MTPTERSFRKKPVVIQAIQVPNPNDEAAWEAVCKFIEAGCEDWVSLSRCFEFETLEGTMRANVGDWIIRGVKGEYYPCKPDIFEATYEPA